MRRDGPGSVDRGGGWRGGWIQAGGAGLLLGMFSACAVPEAGFLGPFPVRTQHPVELTVLDLSPRRGRVLPKGRVEARLQVVQANQALTSHGGRRDEAFMFDLESTRVSLPLRMGLGGGLDLEVQPAFLRPTPGFLDGFIENFHDALNFPNGERDELGRYHYRAFVDKGGDRVYRLEPGQVHLEDLPMTLSFQVLRDHPWLPDMVVRAALEAPLRKSAKGGGNGGWDEGLGAAFSRKMAGLELSGTVSWVHPHTPNRVRRHKVRYANRWSSGFAVELPLTGRLTAITQLRYHQSVLGNMNARRLNKPQLLVWAGGRLFLSDRAFLEGALGEDLIQKVSPDVAFHLALGVRF